METTVVLIEDNALNSRLTQKVLEMAGMDVHIFTSAELALEQLHDINPQLILLDLQLPGISGYDFARQIRRIPHYTDTVVIAVSANVREEDKTQALEAGCDGFVEKPINTRTLAKQLKSYLE